jgi:hypothetical protein
MFHSMLANCRASPRARASEQLRNPSCLISCSHRSPEGGRMADVGRHGAMKPAGRARERNDMERVRRLVAAGRQHNGAAQFTALHAPKGE